MSNKPKLEESHVVAEVLDANISEAIRGGGV